MKSIRDFRFDHKTVFLRVDYNVPFNEKGEIVDDTRIRASLPTLQYLIQHKAKIVLASHAATHPVTKLPYSLQPVAERLSVLLNADIHFVNDCIGEDASQAKLALKEGEVLLLENVRMHAEEEQNDLVFAQVLSEGIDIYINDAFGAVHRNHASIAALPSIVFDKGYGLLIEKELKALEKITHNPEQPFVVVMGGAKSLDKTQVMEHLAPQADTVLVGGALANTFLRATGMQIGKSRYEPSVVAVAERILSRFASEHSHVASSVSPKSPRLPKIVLPIDVVVAAGPDDTAAYVVSCSSDAQIPDDALILDIGPRTLELYARSIHSARTLFWNGPMGMYEKPLFADGTRAVAQAIADSSAYAVLGGGDTDACVSAFGIQDRFAHVSTGGGASLAYLAGQALPGIISLD